MTIGFSSQDFYRKYPDSEKEIIETTLNLFRAGGKANAFEIHCELDELKKFIGKKTDLLDFEFVSYHAPKGKFRDAGVLENFLKDLRTTIAGFGIKNIIFHPDLIGDWGVFGDFKDLPISIENMDEVKNFGRSREDIKYILENTALNLTIDLQHAFVNGGSMDVAEDLQVMFKDRIVEYHISGFGEKILHYPLFKTKQDNIIKALEYKNLPIIIESTFDEAGEEKEELDYIISKLK